MLKCQHLILVQSWKLTAMLLLSCRGALCQSLHGAYSSINVCEQRDNRAPEAPGRLSDYAEWGEKNMSWLLSLHYCVAHTLSWMNVHSQINVISNLTCQSQAAVKGKWRHIDVFAITWYKCTSQHVLKSNMTDTVNFGIMEHTLFFPRMNLEDVDEECLNTPLVFVSTRLNHLILGEAGSS